MQENVEIMRRMMEATARRDYQAVLADVDPDLKIDDTDIPEGTATDSFLFDAVVTVLRGGKAVETGYYNDHAQTLKAVGLEE